MKTIHNISVAGVIFPEENIYYLGRVTGSQSNFLPYVNDKNPPSNTLGEKSMLC